ncbi:hypothetical protein EJD97_018977 [Solanum chilense]|uniref:F-box domain-containing protein n=1 Tax=Solanum chilense TaxID=4083 RepID=A0A6N2B2P2_SOLCI|nr:hypothetical protein EJD97_018977 [Solanum chilense]
MLSLKNQKPKIVKEYVYVKCDYKRKRAYEVTIMDFSREIMVEILSRLTIKPIFRCKTVCKRWYNLLTSDPLFVKMYQSRSCNFPCILLSNDDSVALVLELKADYDYYSRPRNRPVMLSSKFHLPRHKDRFGYSFDRSKLELIGSCNGLICLWSGNRYDENYSSYISNPLLGEYFKVKLPEWEKRVCNLGVDEKWRNAGEVAFPLFGRFGNVNVNGALYWLKDDDDIKTSASIHLFNLVTEEHVDIWWMKEDGIADSWTKDRILTNSIPHHICSTDLIPIIFWKNGEILMQSRRHTELLSYNTKEKKFNKVKVYNGSYEATKYIPSFYSLKTVMSWGKYNSTCISIPRPFCEVSKADVGLSVRPALFGLNGT